MNTLSQFPGWIEKVKALASEDFDFLEVVYPFRAAFDRDLTPEQAFAEARAHSNGD